MQHTVQLEAKVFGNKRSIVRRQIELRELGSEPTLESLISAIVAVEVALFEQRQEKRSLVRLLTEPELQEAAKIGKVVTGPATTSGSQVEVDEAVEVALLGFRDGLYIVLIDDEEATDLGVPVHVGESSSVMFIRLVALAGGW